MSALNKPMRPRTFHRVLFETVLLIFIDTVRENKRRKSSIPKSFCKTFIAKVHDGRMLLFFKMNGLTATRLGRSENRCEFFYSL